MKLSEANREWLVEACRSRTGGKQGERREEQHLVATAIIVATGACQQIISREDTDDDESPLILAARYGYRRVCRVLLDVGVPRDLESLDVMLEEEEEPLALLRELIEAKLGFEEDTEDEQEEGEEEEEEEYHPTSA